MVLLLCLSSLLNSREMDEEDEEASSSDFPSSHRQFSRRGSRDFSHNQSPIGRRRTPEPEWNHQQEDEVEYPEGGWGWIVAASAFLANLTTSGAQLSAGALHVLLVHEFGESPASHCLGGVSWFVSSLSAPLAVNLCRRKNARVVSLVGGILFPLALLATSFATQTHQIFFTFGLIGGVAGSLSREGWSVVLGHYFYRRRQLAESLVFAGTGVGITLFSVLYLSLGRHVLWATGFQIGAGISSIAAFLPCLFPRLERRRSLGKLSRSSSSLSLFPIGGDIVQNLSLFCVPSIKPVLWSAAFASFGLFAPLFLLSDFGRREGLSGGSLLLLQTHLGLGISLGIVISGIVSVKRTKSRFMSPRVLATFSALLTGVAMIWISSVEGYHSYSLAAWVYGLSFGAYLSSLKLLTMDLTRSKHWERVWSSVQCVMSPGVIIGPGLSPFIGKPGFYVYATSVLLAALFLATELIEVSQCGPEASLSEDHESPIPPPPPAPKNPLRPTLRRSMSLQPMFPCCELGWGFPYCRECRDCYPPIVRSTSLPQEPQRRFSSDPAIHQNSGRGPPREINPSFPRRQKFSIKAQIQNESTPPPFIRGSSKRSSNGSIVSANSSNGALGVKKNQQVMFASNPQLYSPTNFSLSSATTHSEGLKEEMMRKKEEPAFTRHYFDSSKFPKRGVGLKSPQGANKDPPHKDEAQFRGYKVSSSDFNVEEPKFNSLGRMPKKHGSLDSAGTEDWGRGVNVGCRPEQLLHHHNGSPMTGMGRGVPGCPYCDINSTFPTNYFPMSLSVPALESRNNSGNNRGGGYYPYVYPKTPYQQQDFHPGTSYGPNVPSVVNRNFPAGFFYEKDPPYFPAHPNPNPPFVRRNTWTNNKEK